MTEISKEYATALYELAAESGQAGAYLEALKIIETAFAAEQAYSEVLSSPNIPMRERRTLLEEAFGSVVPEYVLSFMELLTEKGHLRLFAACVEEYEKLYRALSKISAAHVISAVELTDKEKEALVTGLEARMGHKVTASYTVDASLLGGVVIYVDDQVIDGSLKRRLKEIKEVIGQ